MKVLVTGSSGYVGSRFIERFSADYTFQPFSLQNSSLESLDLAGVDTILHCAALVHQNISYTQEEYDRINAEYPFNLAKKAKTYGVKHFIFISTVAVYQDAEWVNEHSMCRPSTPYGNSKLKAERLLGTLANDSFVISIVRPPMVYGPSAPGNIALLSKLVRTIPILPFKGIDNHRTFVGIDNLIEFIRILLEKPQDGLFLASDETALSTTELVRLIAEALDKKIYLFRLAGFETILKTLRPSLHNKLFGNFVIDNTHTRTKLQFHPPYTPQEGISRMFRKEVLCS